MGWGNWAGFGEVFDSLGQNLGHKRLQGQYDREAAERQQAAEARAVDESLFQQQRRPEILKSDRLTNESLGERIKGEQATTAQTLQKTSFGPEEHKRAGDESAARVRQLGLAGDYDQLRIGSYDQELQSKLDTDAAQRVASGASAGESGARRAVSEFELDQAKEASRPLVLALKAASPQEMEYLRSMSDADTLRKQLGGVSDPERFRVEIDAADRRSDNARIALINRIKTLHREFADGQDYQGHLKPDGTRMTIEDFVPRSTSEAPAGGGTGDPVADAIREMAR